MGGSYYEKVCFPTSSSTPGWSPVARPEFALSLRRPTAYFSDQGTLHSTAALAWCWWIGTYLETCTWAKPGLVVTKAVYSIHPTGRGGVA